MSLTKLNLSARFVFQHPNLRSLTKSLLCELQQNQDPHSSSADTSRLNLAAVRNGYLDLGLQFQPDSLHTSAPTSIFSVTDASGLTAMLSGPKGSREYVLGGEHYPAPDIAKDFVFKYVDRIYCNADTEDEKNYE
ncbi:hypothetical protein DM02DRAFT_669778 [Periconia macrospinosa]|uniref:Uncharacterized protein n=1 Tax=Periconia macrospinosa TaxID=97972 RepID=A0A2V1DYZ5_9PLEO|nr:hypothetical protein DM02DRAFT_669778 [Periconia macrospinosa]